jgi:hypothetical protein
MSQRTGIFSRKLTTVLAFAGFIGLQGALLSTADVHAKSVSTHAANPLTLKKSDRQVANVAANVNQPDGSLLVLTVGLTPGGDGTTCGTATSVIVNVGDTIDFCYTVTNNSTVAMAYSTLDDSVDGNIFTNSPTAIPGGGGTYVYHRNVTATSSNTYAATWTAQDLLPGYTADDTQPAAFVDITASGTGLGLSDDGDIGITIPFPFSFYGVSSTQLCIGNNGVIVFGVADCTVAFTNTALPGSFGGAAIAPYWDDFFQPSGNVYWAVQGTSPNQSVIIEWDRAHYNGGSETSGRAQVEAILGEDGSISFQYQNTTFGTPATFDHGISATIGLQNADSSLVNQYSFDTLLPNPDPSSIVWVSGAATILVANASVSLDVGAPILGLAPTSINASAPSGSTTLVTADLSISNTGNRDLIWSITESAGDAIAPLAPAANGRGGQRAVVLTGADRDAVYAERKLALTEGRPVQADLRKNATTPIASRSPNLVPAGVDCGVSVPGIIVHDDGTAENGYSGNPATVSSFIGVDKFTPSGYPGTFTSVCTSFVTNAGATSVDYEVVIYDDTGAGGGPGAELGAVATTGTVSPDIGTPVFNSVDVSGLGLNIASGSVYIGVRLNPQTETGVYIGSDESGTNPPAGGFVSFDTGAGPAFAPTADSFPDYTSLMVRAVEGLTNCTNPEDISWLSVAPTSGTIVTGGAAANVVVTMNPTGLVDGLYTANVCVNSNDPAARLVPVPVSFTVGDVDPAATVAPGSFDFSVDENATDSDTLTITNSGDPGSNLTYAITEAVAACGTPSDVTWLSASPASGSVPVGTPGSVTVAVDSAGLAPGSYSGNLCLATNDALQPTITVPVTLTVLPPDLIFRDGFDGAPVCDPQQLLEDTSFEASLDGTGPWDSTSSNFGTALCDEASCGNGNGTATPRTGLIWAWLGGSSGQEDATATQTVTIPSGGTRFLNFYLWIGSVAGNGSNMDVTVDSDVVESYPEPAAAESGYTLRSVDLSAYADGASHTVGFSYSGISSNYSVDDVTLDCEAAAPRPAH